MFFLSFLLDFFKEFFNFFFASQELFGFLRAEGFVKVTSSPMEVFLSPRISAKTVFAGGPFVA